MPASTAQLIDFTPSHVYGDSSVPNSLTLASSHGWIYSHTDPILCHPRHKPIQHASDSTQQTKASRFLIPSLRSTPRTLRPNLPLLAYTLPPGRLGPISLPLEYGILRTIVKWVLYSVAAVHAWEASTAYKLSTDHRAPASVTILYTLSTFIFGFPILNEMDRQIRRSRTETISAKRSS
ncbi:uncharacterized protein EI90DRAFT_3118889 [Cantharellus anzutake]|uniref:uncharacterized protein n=1 Tax=Cantharellus anzutake TaxID=1750568 RepID=UPI0019079608|nr:uncharacterized protein EI90DRAFT_3118889 [Cantharellus anzutake]KAF8337436.1 hypothetical protein EI90DRAFT_3118889 [Cantharellus anzutake]